MGSLSAKCWTCSHCRHPSPFRKVIYFNSPITVGYTVDRVESHLLARLRFRHLQLIAEVDRTGSLSRAAEVMMLTQPALSKALKEVEGMLGFAVFDRGSRGLQKTAQGAVVVQGALLMLRELQHVQVEAEAAGAQGVSGLLRLGTSAFIALSRLPGVEKEAEQSGEEHEAHEIPVTKDGGESVER